MDARPLLALLVLTLALAVPTEAEIRLDAAAQWRLGEGMATAGPGLPQGRYISVAESYFILEPILTAGWEGHLGGFRFGAGVRGIFPHPLAGETRAWPLGWAEFDLAYGGIRTDLGWGVVRMPQDQLTRWEPLLVPGLQVFLTLPPWAWFDGRFGLQPRVALDLRGFVNASVPKVNPFTAGLDLGLVATF